MFRWYRRRKNRSPTKLYCADIFTEKEYDRIALERNTERYKINIINTSRYIICVIYSAYNSICSDSIIGIGGSPELRRSIAVK